MKLPELMYGNNKTRLQTVAFGGVNYSENHQEGEWAETENLGGGRFPALSPRMGRAVARVCEGAPTALYAWEKLASVEGTGFYYGGEYVGEVSPGPKQMVRVGNWIVIWPDKKYYNWKTGEFTELEVGFVMHPELSSVIEESRIILPDRTYAFRATEGAEPVTYTGSWLGVQQEDRKGVRVYIGGDMTGYTQVSIDQVQEGTRIYSEVTGGGIFGESATLLGTVTEVVVVESEYMPGIMRNWAEVTYKDADGVTKKLTGWAYTTDRAILNAAYEPDLGNVAYQLTKGRWSSKVEYKKSSWAPSLNETNSRTPVNDGDILFWDAETSTAQQISGIQRMTSRDHSYTSEYTLTPVTLVEVRQNEDPETVCAELGIQIGAAVRVSRGSVSIDTKILGFDGSVNLDESLPGMSDAVYAIRFEDDISKIRAESGVVSVDRITDPDLTYICVHDNRLWGVHEERIWCSKFGDPQDFDTASGTDADAWWTEVGSPGDWTGIVSYSGSVLAFKENLVHKVVGDLPSDFTINTYNIAGIQPGSHQSTAIVNEVLFYKGTGGVYAYSGYTPSFLSDNFGERKFHDAVGGTDGVRYYLSMRDEEDAWQLYCYDTLHGIWLREDDLHAAAFSLHEGKLYCAAEEQGEILTFGEAMDPEKAWQAVSVPFTEGSFDRKLYTKLLIRAEMTPGSALRVWVSYDGGEWVRLYDKRGERRGVAILPVRPKRCDRFRLKLEGTGDVTLLGIAREVLTGSEV